MVIVTAKIEFTFGRTKYRPGDKVEMTKERAQVLADQGFIKSIAQPIIDKMIKEPKRRK